MRAAPPRFHFNYRHALAFWGPLTPWRRAHGYATNGTAATGGRGPVVQSSLIPTLRERGLLADIAGDADALTKAAENGPLGIYCGLDPTAESLHVGNLLCLMALAWCQRLGHRPVCVLGGATGRIGDPSGKSVERPLLDEDAVTRNAAKIKANVTAILARVPGAAGTECEVVDNYDWWKNMTVMDFLRDVGRHARVGTMLSKESVRNRLDSENGGLSFTEFSYQLLQGYDFAELHKTRNISVQFGGSDQWGNITAGTELIRKTRDSEAFGFTLPLLLKSDGTKYGKSESGAIWLSPEKLSAYGFYQALLATADADVERLLRSLTFLPLEEIEGLLEPSLPPNTAQRRLAAEVTWFVHGDEGLAAALTATHALAPGSRDAAAVPAAAVLQAAVDAGADTRAVPQGLALGAPLVEVLVETGIQPSKGAARRLIQGRGVRLNNRVIEDVAAKLEAADLIDGRRVLISLGKKNKIVLDLV